MISNFTSQRESNPLIAEEEFDPLTRTTILKYFRAQMHGAERAAAPEIERAFIEQFDRSFPASPLAPDVLLLKAMIDLKSCRFDRVRQTLFDWLARNGELWDTCVFEQLREDSPLLHTPVPEGWGEAEFGALVRAYQRRAYAVARAIVVTSAATGARLVEGFGVEPERITVAPPVKVWALAHLVANNTPSPASAQTPLRPEGCGNTECQGTVYCRYVAGINCKFADRRTCINTGC